MQARSLLKLLTMTSLILTYGCATQHQVGDSQSAEPTRIIESIAVVAVTDDAAERIHFEETVALGLHQQGIQGTATYGQLPTIDSMADETTIKAMYADTGADSSLTIEVVQPRSEAAQKTREVSSVIWWAALILDQPEIRRAAALTSVASHGEAGKYSLRLTLWDAGTGTRLWTTDTRSFTNDNIGKDAKLLADLAANELRASGWIH